MLLEMVLFHFLTTSELVPLKKLRYYEKVRPHQTDGRNPLRFARSRFPEEHPEKLSITFTGFGRRFRLKLKKNEELFAESFKVLTQGSDGTYVKNDEARDHCYYHGHLVGHPDTSTVAVSTCRGIHGLIKDEKTKDEFVIQPHPDSNSTEQAGFLEQVSLIDSASSQYPENVLINVHPKSHKTRQ